MIVLEVLEAFLSVCMFSHVWLEKIELKYSLFYYCVFFFNVDYLPLVKVVLRPKKQFLFSFGFQKYVNETLTDASIKF